MIDVSISSPSAELPAPSGVYHSARNLGISLGGTPGHVCDRNDYLALYCETREAAEDLAAAFQQAGCVRVVDVLNVRLTNHGR